MYLLSMVVVTWLCMNQQILMRLLMSSLTVVPSQASSRFMVVVMLLLLLQLMSESTLPTKSMRRSVVVMVRMSTKLTTSGMRTLVPMWATMQHSITPLPEVLHKEILIPLLKTMVLMAIRMQRQRMPVVPTILTERVLPGWRLPVDVSIRPMVVVTRGVISEQRHLLALKMLEIVI